MKPRSTFTFSEGRRALAALLLSMTAASVSAPGAAAPADAKAAESKPAEARPEGPLAPLAWLAGCWRGQVNQREFREHWMPLRGDLMIGTGHTVVGGRTQDYEYLRLEPRADGVYYVAAPSKQKEAAFRLGERATDGSDEIFTFSNPGHDFPQAIVYRRGSEGWLYVHVEGKIGGEDRKVIYPFRRVDCQTGEFIRQ
jgi:hypothetical protein